MAKKKETKAIVYDPCDSCEVKKLNALLQSFIMNKADIFGIQFNDKMFHFDKMVKFTHDSEIEKLEQQIKELLTRLAEKDKEIEKIEKVINETRNILRGILIVEKRPVKGTTKEECYVALKKLQDLFKMAYGITTEYFLREIKGESK